MRLQLVCRWPFFFLPLWTSSCPSCLLSPVSCCCCFYMVSIVFFGLFFLLVSLMVSLIQVQLSNSNIFNLLSSLCYILSSVLYLLSSVFFNLLFSSIFDLSPLSCLSLFTLWLLLLLLLLPLPLPLPLLVILFLAFGVFISLNSFFLIPFCVGQGSRCQIFLARHVPSDVFVAMKRMDLSQIQNTADLEDIGVFRPLFDAVFEFWEAHTINFSSSPGASAELEVTVPSLPPHQLCLLCGWRVLVECLPAHVLRFPSFLFSCLAIIVVSLSVFSFRF